MAAAKGVSTASVRGEGANAAGAKAGVPQGLQRKDVGGSARAEGARAGGTSAEQEEEERQRESKQGEEEVDPAAVARLEEVRRLVGSSLS